jgi:hypothetical protein
VLGRTQQKEKWDQVLAMSLVGCPFFGCRFEAATVKALHAHARRHVVEMECRSCGRWFRSMREWEAHFRDQEGCGRNKRRRRGVLAGPADDDNNDGEAQEADWQPVQEGENNDVWKPLEIGPAPPLHVLEGGFDGDELDRLVEDVIRVSKERLEERFVDDETILGNFNRWYNDDYLQRRYKVATESNPDPLVRSLVADVIQPHGFTRKAIRSLYDWLSTKVAPRVQMLVDEFSVFERRLNERCCVH